MYVCICAGLNEKKVNAAIDAGARSPAKVLRHHGGALQCGKCVGMIRDMMSERVGNCHQCPNRTMEVALEAVTANDHTAHEHLAHGHDEDMEIAAYGVAAE